MIYCGTSEQSQRSYLDFAHQFDLLQRGVFWVTRAKDNMAYQVIATLPVSGGNILHDELIVLSTPVAARDYPEVMCRITALVEIDGREQEMIFLTNNMKWSPASVADIYRCCWSIEALFKQIKQTLQLSDFLGHSASAVRWQIWTALLVYVLLRFLAFTNGWNHSFTCIFILIRSALWHRWDLSSLLQSYGTASGAFRFIATPQQPCYNGF